MMAVISLGLGVASAFGFLFPVLTLFALPSIGLGIVGVVHNRKYEQRGQILAVLGIAVALTSVVTAPLWHIDRYNSETFVGYERLDFSSLADRKDGLSDHLGHNVCLKGYALYPNKQFGVTQFALSPDGSRFNAVKQAVIVQLPPGDTWNYHDEPIAVSGILERNPEWKADAADVPQFVLKLSYVRMSRTLFGLANRNPSGGC